MKWINGALGITATCLALAACGAPDPAVDPPGDGTIEVTTERPGDTGDTGGSGDSGDSGDSTAPGGGHERTDDPPDLPKGPIDYDNTRTGGGRSPQDVKADMEGQLAEKCGRKLCGVKVVLTGGKDCVDSVTPRPVPQGGRINVKTRDCRDGERPDLESESAAPKSKGSGTDESAGPPSAG